MTKQALPKELLIITSPTLIEDRASPGRRRSVTTQLLNAQSVDITSLQGQVNIFLQQLNVVMSETPEKVGGFELAEFEVSAGITVSGKGQVKLALLASGELGGSVNAGLKFVFKRS